MLASRLLSVRRDCEKMGKQKRFHQMRKTLTRQKVMMKSRIGLLELGQVGSEQRPPRMVMERSLSIAVSSYSVGMGSIQLAETARSLGSEVAKTMRTVDAAVVAQVAS